MKGEIVDIVDEQNTVLYQATKEEAHEKGLLHRTVIGEVRDSDGNWILVVQASDRQDADQYVSPVGGHVRAGESEDAALLREGIEEIGLDSFAFKLVQRFVYNRYVLGRQENHYFIVYQIITDEAFILGDEAVEVRKFTEKEISQTLKNNPALFGAAFIAVVQQGYPHLILKDSN